MERDELADEPFKQMNWWALNPFGRPLRAFIDRIGDMKLVAFSMNLFHNRLNSPTHLQCGSEFLWIFFAFMLVRANDCKHQWASDKRTVVKRSDDTPLACSNAVKNHKKHEQKQSISRQRMQSHGFAANKKKLLINDGTNVWVVKCEINLLRQLLVSCSRLMAHASCRHADYYGTSFYGWQFYVFNLFNFSRLLQKRSTRDRTTAFERYRG